MTCANVHGKCVGRGGRGERRGEGEEGGLCVGSFILLPITINQLQVYTYNPETSSSIPTSIPTSDSENTISNTVSLLDQLKCPRPSEQSR